MVTVLQRWSPVLTSFNSSMVQLNVKGEDGEANYFNMFQFLYGTIKCFTIVTNNYWLLVFQFLYGIIKCIFNSGHFFIAR